MAPLTRRARRAALLSFAAAALLNLIAGAGSAQPTDTDVKAAFVPRFARYVTWPPTAAPRAGQPFVVCVMKDAPFARAVEAAARSQSVDGRRIVVRNLSPASSTDGCHILFGRGGDLPAAGAARSMLTVTDGSGPRGIIHFTVVNGRVRFFVDQSAAQRRQLQISSRLLALAVGVRQ